MVHLRGRSKARGSTPEANREKQVAALSVSFSGAYFQVSIVLRLPPPPPPSPESLVILSTFKILPSFNFLSQSWDKDNNITYVPRRTVAILSPDVKVSGWCPMC